MGYSYPEYAQIIVVGVIFRDVFSWYITDREYWFLDYVKYTELSSIGIPLKNRYVNPEPYKERFDIAVLNEKTAAQFLSCIEDMRVPTSKLIEMMLEWDELKESYDDMLDFIPCFLINFDKKQFSSIFPEPFSFEMYVPDGWIGRRHDFVAEIPEEERYWIANGRDLFQR
ncbi:hypothetical protein [Tengunoibacter tsumagoiensis]|uniref:Uncharacterized protein n=1 Tax=Tengunoibacter tsumagoiensis TaxID=2014871 RepID=A0A401ZYV4_9CHLR|nr:hypothetical protein [Tengunoibacter tsumagoiensis]GCE12021.1 hypothetical protein KTT_18800 [Tengunoibacter tsumagoiensis]